MSKFVIQHLMSGGIITNYYCTSACRHCLYRSSPHRAKEYLDAETAKKLLDCVRRLGCSAVHIGGGEPLLKPDKLGELLALARQFGLDVDYVETNSSWFRDADSADRMLKQLKNQGLRTLLVSISPFHNEFIPFAKVKSVVEACRRVGIGIFPWTSDFIADLSEFDLASTHSLEEYSQRFGRGYLQRLLGRYWIHMGGRALDLFRPVLESKSCRQILEGNPGGCAHELSDTSHFHFDLFGNYIPGLCSGLAIQFTDLGQPLAVDQYPFLSILYHSGITGLFDHARDSFGFRPLQSAYVNKCDLCTQIRGFLVTECDVRSADLNPVAFYTG